MRVIIRMGDSFETLSKPHHTYRSATKAREVIEAAIRSGHTRYGIYVIEEVAGPPMSAEAKERLARLKAKGESA